MSLSSCPSPRIHQICAQGILDTLVHLRSGMQESTVLEDEHSARFGVNIHLEVPRVERRRSSFQVASTCDTVVEIQMECVEGRLLAIRSRVLAVQVACNRVPVSDC
jgi:hypothetical protein